jgi:hypothetical protein
LATYKNVILQIRRGVMTLAALEQVVSIVRLARARLRGKGGALIGVIEESAELSSGAVRARQKELLRNLLEHERSWAATIVDQSTVKGALLRTSLRLLVLGHARTGVFGTPLDAGTWLASRVNLPAAELASLVSWGRQRADRRG